MGISKSQNSKFPALNTHTLFNTTLFYSPLLSANSSHQTTNTTMPSFKFIALIATAVLAAVPTMAQTPPRGRPNHADQFGYPHNRPKPAPGTPRQPMTPGGYRDPRPANLGTECRYNNQCSSDIPNSSAYCSTEGTCEFRCLGNTMFDGTTCAGQVLAQRCSFDRQCPTSVDNATGVCYNGRCSFACNSGFFASGSTCAASAQTCGGVECPSINGGYNVCENNTCTARCEAQLGYKQYCNADNTSCQCIQTAVDVNNCGTPGNVCPGSYTGLGRAYCSEGFCQLSCNRLVKVTPRDGSPQYCSRS